MSDKLVIELNPARVEMEPGAAPVEVVVTLQNKSDVVEQYTLEVEGLDTEWYTAPVTSVGLFPQDRDQVRLTLHPPKRPGQKAGTYPFRVVVRARGGAEAESAEGILDVRGFAVYRVDLTPRRITARGQGAYRLTVTNSGTVDVRLGFEGRDAEETCRIKFPKGAEAVIAAAAKTDLPVIVQPRKRPWIGPEQSYDFTLSARPIDARGEPQVVAGQFTHKPLFRKLPVGGLVKFAAIALVLLIGLIVLFATGIPEQFPQRMAVASGTMCGTLYRVPVLNGMCSDGPAARPLPLDSCTFDFGFKEFADNESRLVGECTTNVAYDGFGNGIQYTKNGVLFWSKASNTVYLFSEGSVYGFIQGKARLLDGTGRL